MDFLNNYPKFDAEIYYCMSGFLNKTYNRTIVQNTWDLNQVSPVLTNVQREVANFFGFC